MPRSPDGLDEDLPLALGPSSQGIRKLLPRTLFGRSLLIIVTPVVLAQLVATWIFYDRHWETMTNRLAFAVAGEIAFVVDQLERETDANARDRIMVSANDAMDLQVSLEKGFKLPNKPPPLRGMLQRTLGRALDEQVKKPFIIDTHKAQGWYEIRVQLPNGVLKVLSPERRLYSPTTYIFILWMIGSALVLFAIAIVFMRNQIRPIKRLAVAAESFGKGRDVANFKLEGASEVRQAAAAFLIMRNRIRRQISQRTEMLAGVSHDLRTPLTRMKLQLELLGDSPDIEELKADVAEMESMIEGYLQFARGEGTEPMVTTDLTRLLREEVYGARRAGAQVELSMEKELLLPLRANAFKRCIGNLLSNARRHAQRIWVYAARNDNLIEIVIDDDGPGIPEDAREDVFKPFFRLDQSRNAETGGAGLGMTIARDVVRGLGGDLLLSQSPQGGLRVVIRVPE